VSSKSPHPPGSTPHAHRPATSATNANANRRARPGRAQRESATLNHAKGHCPNTASALWRTEASNTGAPTVHMRGSVGSEQIPWSEVRNPPPACNEPACTGPGLRRSRFLLTPCPVPTTRSHHRGPLPGYVSRWAASDSPSPTATRLRKPPGSQLARRRALPQRQTVRRVAETTGLATGAHGCHPAGQSRLAGQSRPAAHGDQQPASAGYLGPD
jgi:hypothetical protein